MSITRIKASNFKSFKDFELELNNFNVLIGGNASGKSNFVEIFQFLRDLANFDIEKAIYMHGGFEYLPNIRVGKSKNLTLGLTSDIKFRIAITKIVDTEEKIIGIRFLEEDYEINIQFTEEKIGYKVAKEFILFKCHFFELENVDGDYKEKEKLGKGSIKISSNFGKIDLEIEKETGIPLENNDIVPDTLINLIENVTVESPILSLLNTPLSSLPIPWKSIFTDLKIYDFDPKKSKNTTKITGTDGLDEDGENLAIVLQDIVENDEESRKFYNFLQDMLPFIDKIDVKSFFDKSLIFMLKEKQMENAFLPASEISDGTINVIALIVALFYEKLPFIIIEEPERNIHPYLISKMVELMKESAKRKQIILTTHSPEILKYAGMKHLYFISRDQQFFSKIFKPIDKEEVRAFLDQDIGIEELYIDNLLGD